MTERDDHDAGKASTSRRDFVGALAALPFAMTGCSAPAPRTRRDTPVVVDAPEPDHLAFTFPPRRDGSVSGGAWVDGVMGLTAGERERSAAAEVLERGNVPAFLSRFVALTIEEKGRRLTVYVAPDYVSIGNDADFFRYPFAGRTAYRMANALRALPPTRKLVDLVYARAALKLTSPRFSASPQMTGTEAFAAHEAEVERRRRASKTPLGALVAGHKKDVVISARQSAEPGHVAIYGWFKADGEVVQSLSLVHDERYADYTHGLRLVARAARLDGDDVDLVDLLGDRALSSLVSDEGPFRPANVVGFR